LHSTCKEVKSNKRGGASFPSFFVMEVMVKGAFFICSSSASPCSSLAIGSMPGLDASAFCKASLTSKACPAFSAFSFSFSISGRK
jgi:hypothetical protein